MEKIPKTPGGTPDLGTRCYTYTSIMKRCWFSLVDHSMTTGTNTLANHRQPCKQCRPIEKIKTQKNLACSRLRDSRVSWIEKANTKIKRVETGESVRQLSACLFLSRLPHNLRAWNRLIKFRLPIKPLKKIPTPKINSPKNYTPNFRTVSLKKPPKAKFSFSKTSRNLNFYFDILLPA